MKARLSFAWMSLIAAIFSSSASFLLTETGIEALDIEEFINEKSSNQDLNPIQIGSPNREKHLEIKTLQKNTNPLRIAAFNIEQFGKKKFKNEAVMEIIKEIIRLYDVILIQEVMGGIVDNFVKELNRDRMDEYIGLASEKLGSKHSHQEHYLFLIRENRGISFDMENDTYQFNDSTILFERPPFSIRLRYAGIPFALMAIHTKPEEAEKEIRQLLQNVYPEIKEWAQTNNILIMGDLNAGEGYISKSKLTLLKAISDVNKMPFIWPLEDDQYTTVCSDNAHDRFIMTEDLITWMVDGSARVFQFDNKSDPNFRQDFKAIASCRVSDHYPIELKLEFKPNANRKPNNPNSSNSKTGDSKDKISNKPIQKPTKPKTNPKHTPKKPSKG